MLSPQSSPLSSPPSSPPRSPRVNPSPASQFQSVFALNWANERARGQKRGRDSTPEAESAGEVEMEGAEEDEMEEGEEGVQVVALDLLPTKDCDSRKGKAYKRSKKTAMLPQLRSQLHVQQEFGVEAEQGGWMHRHAPSLPQDTHAFQVLQLLSEGVLSNLHDPRCLDWIDHLRTYAGGMPYTRQHVAFASQSLEALVERCNRDEEMVATLDFIGMVNRLQLAVKVDR